eukprot:Hpha_TRINITY_DN15915_c5_g2::TRINITY_DN15915_c5_g2_i4::g.73264::m.73264
MAMGMDMCADEIMQQFNKQVRDKCKEISDDQGRKRQRAINRGDEEAEKAGEGHRWTQSKDDVTLTVPLPAGTRASHLNITIGQKKIHVGLKSGERLCVGTLAHVVQPDESIWTVDGKEVSLQLIKGRGDAGGGITWKKLWEPGEEPAPPETKGDAQKKKEELAENRRDKVAEDSKAA